MDYKSDMYSIVLDPGSYSIRAGHAIDNLPQLEIPAIYGVVEESDGSAARVRTTNNMCRMNAHGCYQLEESLYFHGTNAMQVPRENMEATFYMEDGMIEDWDVFETVVDYAFRKCLRTRLEDYALLMSEAPWNHKGKREKTMELMFEKFGIPAFYLAKNAVLAAFGSARCTALVVDSGLMYTTAIPVFDGICLTQGIRKSAIAGNYIAAQIDRHLKGSKVEVVPPYLVHSKTAVGRNMPAQWTKRINIPEVTESWERYQRRQVIDDIKANVIEVLPQTFTLKTARAMRTACYEFPNGYNKKFGPERYKFPEAIFQPRILFPTSRRPSIIQIIKESINVCPKVTRKILYSSIVVTGGNSMLKGFCRRLSKELSAQTSDPIKMTWHKKRSWGERRYGTWRGGAALVSSKHFKKLWISKKEYEECGTRQIHIKCP